MKVGSLSSAANTSLHAINEISREVEKVAEHVAAGISLDGHNNGADPIGQLARLPMLRQQMGANINVFSTVESLFSDLGSLSRR